MFSICLRSAPPPIIDFTSSGPTTVAPLPLPRPHRAPSYLRAFALGVPPARIAFSLYIVLTWPLGDFIQSSFHQSCSPTLLKIAALPPRTFCSPPLAFCSSSQHLFPCKCAQQVICSVRGLHCPTRIWAQWRQALLLVPVAYSTDE